jgi:DNA-binding MarR family transcriptional regulator
MTKIQLLTELDIADRPNAHDIAETLDVSYPAVAMALLRLVRQGLAARYLDPDSGHFWYQLTPKGESRLDYLDSDGMGERNA